MSPAILISGNPEVIIPTSVPVVYQCLLTSVPQPQFPPPHTPHTSSSILDSPARGRIGDSM